MFTRIKSITPKNKPCPHCHHTLHAKKVHGIVFCTHCDNSVIVNPTPIQNTQKTNDNNPDATASISLKSAFMDFYQYHQKPIIITLIIPALLWLMIGTDFLKISWIYWLMFFGVMVVSAILKIINYEKNTQYYLTHHYPIKKGVDSLTDIKNNFKFSLAHNQLSEYFDPYSPYCPKCISQRLTLNPLDEHQYTCQNCLTHICLHPKLISLKKWYHTYTMTPYLFIIPSAINHVDGVYFYLVLELFIIVMIALKFMFYYLFIGCPKWVVNK
ncbi:hypothetical protein LU293_05140 [Moraxella nasovis]|uniref:hypothetical protein n=1 Tax=Moraxella nasovis TaxID=2904121 RepID=UPI001F60FD07|nr:hypothetical protein [Moraxella nasovis]UNU72510.1 hypothetical protein LU293_05140 [Moraxella nasovis]